MQLEKKRNTYKNWLILHADRLCCGVIALAMLLLLVLYAGKKSFFSDEMDQIGILVSCGSLKEVLSLYASMEHEVAPPLFAVVAYLWYQLAPLTQRWLLILPAIAASIGVYITGMCGQVLGGKRVAVLSALFACALPAMASTIGTQFRQYAFVFLFAALTLYAYLRRLQHSGNERISDIVLDGVVMAGLPYSHYLSVFVCFYFFAIDVILLARKRIRPVCLLSYGIGATLFLPWGITILQSLIRISSFWIPIPRILDIRDALYFLTDTFSLRFYLYVGGVCTVTLAALRHRNANGSQTSVQFVELALALAAPVMMAFLYVYSRFFSNGVSLFLPRYFLCTLPMVIVTSAMFADRLFRLLMNGKQIELRTVSMSFLLICAVLFGMSAWSNVQTYTSEILEPYHEAADFLCAQADIYDEDVAVITSGESRYVTAGFKALYVTQGGKRPPFVIFDRETPFTVADATQYKNVYVMKIHAALPPESEQTLLSYYELHEHQIDGRQLNVWYYGRTAG